MSWSFRIGRLFGIDVYIHATFFLLLAWIVIAQYLSTRSAGVAVYEMLFVTLVFGIVVLHELGHALAARRFGVQTRDITLLPIGGVARLERIPENPYQEFVIAIAGPAVNVVLAILCLGWILARGSLQSEIPANLLHADLAGRLLSINVALVVFNMIPAFPMDGGRVLRAVLAMGMDYVRATTIAASVGQVFALLLGFGGLVTGNPFLLFIALFVWIGAAQEASVVAARASLAGIPVRYAMISDFRVVSPTDSLEAIAHHVIAGFQQDFPVVEDGRVVGMMTRSDLIKALADAGRQGNVADVMQRAFVAVHPDEALTEAFQKLQTCECHSMPVLKDGQLVGLLTAENVGEFLMIRNAVRQQASRSPAPLVSAPRA
jgi:Zn-dependent protease